MQNTACIAVLVLLVFATPPAEHKNLKCSSKPVKIRRVLLIFLSIINPNDEVILSDPHYSCYPSFITVADGIPQYLKVEEGEGFQYILEEVRTRITDKTKAIIIAPAAKAPRKPRLGVPINSATPVRDHSA